ncbi:hypothetical protein [Streptomyces djakartensis]|uniref:DUF3618 domain-containing protein n=1 Tax=Streptomyces djakartensis TaxID=68193 RepID=A0ABQ3A763_9ACTN|nr:hypothetical protein [Streptomyces djakartensis]GGY38173.1 hypothetical protein GCM10010384_51630 [Streptomyces djakartensis]
MSDAVQGNAARLQQTGDTAREEASATAGEARQATGQLAGTAADQARAVAGEARQQAGVAVRDLRSRAMSEVEEQSKRAAGTLRQWADDLSGLAENAQSDSPARSLAGQAADGGHRAADYLEKQGVEGVLADVQDFARRRPGAFLGGALLAGLAVGRLVKVAAKADRSSGNGHQEAARTPEQVPPGTGRESPPTVAPAPPQAPPAPGVPSGGAPSRPYPEV